MWKQVTQRESRQCVINICSFYNVGTHSCESYCFKTDLFFCCCCVFFVCFVFNQLGKVNELIIKPDLSDLTDKEEEEDNVEKSEEKEEEEETSLYRADCVYTVTSLDSAFNTVIEKHFSPALRSK